MIILNFQNYDSLGFPTREILKIQYSKVWDFNPERFSLLVVNFDRHCGLFRISII